MQYSNRVVISAALATSPHALAAAWRIRGPLCGVRIPCRRAAPAVGSRDTLIRHVFNARGSDPEVDTCVSLSERFPTPRNLNLKAFEELVQTAVSCHVVEEQWLHSSSGLGLGGLEAVQ